MPTITDVFQEPFGAHAIPRGRTVVHVSPDNLDEMKADYMEDMPLGLLFDELAQAEAGFTGKQTACVIETRLLDENTGYWRHEHGVYAGHVEERAPGNFESAIMMAIRQISNSDERISRVSIAGRGIHKAKHLMPSCADYDALQMFMTPRSQEPYGSPTDIALLYPATFDDVFIVNREDFEPAYDAQPYSDLSDSDWEEFDPPGALGGLRTEDGEFLRHLRSAGFTHRLSSYLTGSASFRGPSTALKGTYDDIDLAVTGEQGKDAIEDIVQEVAEYHYGVMERTDKHVIGWETGRIVDGLLLANEVISIDLFAGHALQAVMVRPEYFAKNFFHQL